ncbi:hypothetical protein [Neobacillus sp. FSL H8-0543]|uniref:hypothetical protein n=1 Tax=Neobacillus sp. FSL H8-0543 TaxID=2954672 RepID=UPI0031590C7E
MGEKKIYILFTATGSWLTKLIQLYTRKTYNHVSLSFDEQLNETYSFGRKKAHNPFIGGFVREKIAEGLFKKATCEVYSYTISETEYNQMKQKVQYFEAMKDLYRYNFIGLFAIIFNYDLKRKNAFFCSQFVATILNEKKHVIDKSPNLCTPQDLMDVEQLQLVYQGPLNAYPYQDINEETLETLLELRPWNPILYNSHDFINSPYV